MLTVYAISLLTDRTFIIKNELSKNCFLQKFLLPNEINWLNNVTDIYNNLTRNYIEFSWYGKIKDSHFSQINFLEYYEDTDILTASTGMQLIKHLTINKNHHEKIKQLGYSLNEFTIENMIDKWYNKLFKLNNNLDKNLNEIISRVNNSRFICAQIRIGGEMGIPFVPRSNTKLFWNFIRTNFLANNSIKDFKLFVTSDFADVVDEAYNEFGANNVIGFKNNSFHIHFASNLNKTCDDVGKIILDFSILSKCEYGIVSLSGFGMFGYINRKDKNYKNLYVYNNNQIVLFNASLYLYSAYN
jgi:hypothetical protein